MYGYLLYDTAFSLLFWRAVGAPSFLAHHALGLACCAVGLYGNRCSQCRRQKHVVDTNGYCKRRARVWVPPAGLLGRAATGAPGGGTRAYGSTQPCLLWLCLLCT